MSIEGDIFNALTALTGGRVYPVQAPDGVVTPYIVYQHVGGESVNFLSGVPDKRNTRLQISVWSDTALGAMNLSRQVEDIMRASVILNATSLGAAFLDKDEETKLYGAQQDFSIWY